LWCVHREFFYESDGERLLKIGPHLPKLLSNMKVYFFKTLVDWFPKFLAMLLRAASRAYTLWFKKKRANFGGL